MKTSSAFKLDKSIKRILSTYSNSHKRGEFKRLMIQAQVNEETSVRTTGGATREKSES